MRSLFLAAALLAPLAACSQDSDVVDAQEYIDGERKMTDDGAFNVELYNVDGMASVGENTFVLRVSFPDPNDRSALGRGIPSASVALDAYMPNDSLTMQAPPVITYVGDGEYELAGVVLDHAGVWQLDFSIDVGETVRENVSFSFEVE